MTDQPPQGGYGQMTPSDVASKYGALQFIIQQLIAQVRTVAIVQVKAVNSAAGTVDVQPLVKQADGVGNTVSHGVIHGMPYFQLQVGVAGIIAVPVVDDIGFAVIADRDSSAVKSTRAEAPPGSPRRNDLADGIYVGGILNSVPTELIRLKQNGIDVVSPEAISMSVGGASFLNLTPTGVLMQIGSATASLTAAGIVMNFGSGTITMGAGGAVITFGSATFIASAGGIAMAFGSNNVTVSPTGIELNGDVTISGDVTMTGDITAGGVSLKYHEHGGVAVGSDTSGPPIPG